MIDFNTLQSLQQQLDQVSTMDTQIKDLTAQAIESLLGVASPAELPNIIDTILNVSQRRTELITSLVIAVRGVTNA